MARPSYSSGAMSGACALCMLACAMVAPAQAVPFADDEELGEAWHAVIGFTRAVPTEQQMHSIAGGQPHVRARTLQPRLTASSLVPPGICCAHFSLCRLRARRNLSRFRKCAYWTGRIVWWYKQAVERLYAPGGLGFAAARASFCAHS